VRRYCSERTLASRCFVFTPARTATFSSSRQNGGRPPAPALASLRKEFQIHDDFLDLRVFLTKRRQHLSYIHFASELLKMPGSFLVIHSEAEQFKA
jgi:hypothetical protein